MEESYEGQVKVHVPGTYKMEWKSVRNSNINGRGYIYRYPTELKAHQMLVSCYPDCIAGEIRIIKVNKPANMS